MKSVTIYTDGGADPNPGLGGWGAIVLFGQYKRELCGAEANTTNNRMELQATISALSALTEPCEVTLHTDSEYLQKGITQWIAGWKRNGWRTATKQPVKNKDLWVRLDELAATHKISWAWVKAHAGNMMNERCDALVHEARATFRSQSNQ